MDLLFSWTWEFEFVGVLRFFVVFLKHHKPTACWPAWALILEAGRRLLFLTLFLGLFLRVWIFCKASEADRTPGWNEGSWPVLLQVPKYFVLSQIFWFNKNLIAFSATPTFFVPAQKTEFMKWKSSFGLAQKNWGLVKFVNQFLVWHKKFRPTKNILGPREGRGLSSWCWIP